MPQLIVSAIIYFVVPNAVYAALAIMAVSMVHQGYEQRKAQRRARDAYNAGLQDRMVMVDILPNVAATLALGKVRAVEGVRRRWQSGVHNETLTMIVSVAGHEIDGFEKHYLNDTEVTLDGSGWVQTAPWLKARTEGATGSVLLDASGSATYETGNGIVADSAFATVNLGADNGDQALTALISGTTVLLSGGIPGATASVTWQRSISESKVRIRTYLGASGQNIGADLEAEYPGKISATDKFSGMAGVVLDLLYDQDVFPQGPPNYTALFRGAKVYDPRTGLTVWSENNALCANHYARHPNGWNLAVGNVREADITAAANDCDESTDFELTMPDTSTSTVTLPRYRCGITIPTDADPRAYMDEIFESMAGKWGWAGGTWRMRAGASAAPVFALNESWVAQLLDEDGNPGSESVVRISKGVPREAKVNHVSGACVDPDQRWQILPFPAVQDPVLIAAKGLAATEVEYAAVNHIAHAQNLAAIRIREGQASLRIETNCNLSAYRCELFDVGTVTLPRYGFDGVLAEVVGWHWHPTQGVVLNLGETAAAIYEPGELNGQDPAPDSSLPPITSVPGVVLNPAESGDNLLIRQSDGTIVTRMRISWAAVTDIRVLQGGRIDVQWRRVSDGASDSDWHTETVDGSATEVFILNPPDGAVIVYKARARNSLVAGDWSVQQSHRVIGKSAPPPDIDAFTVIEQPSQRRSYHWNFNAEPPLDLAGAIARYVEISAIGTAWDSMVPLFEAAGRETRGIESAEPPDGEYEIAIKAIDTSGNQSQTERRISVLLDASGFGTLVTLVRPHELQWPGTKTACFLSGYALIAHSTLTWDTIPDTWDAWYSWDGPSQSPITYQHSTIDLGGSMSIRLRAASLASGASTIEYASSTDNVTYTAWAAIPGSAFTARYVRVRWSVAGDMPILYRAQVAIYT